jgi:hypothetical protein
MELKLGSSSILLICVTLSTVDSLAFFDTSTTTTILTHTALALEQLLYKETNTKIRHDCLGRWPIFAGRMCPISFGFASKNLKKIRYILS